MQLERASRQDGSRYLCKSLRLHRSVVEASIHSTKTVLPLYAIKETLGDSANMSMDSSSWNGDDVDAAFLVRFASRHFNRPVSWCLCCNDVVKSKLYAKYMLPSVNSRMQVLRPFSSSALCFSSIVSGSWEIACIISRRMLAGVSIGSSALLSIVSRDVSSPSDRLGCLLDKWQAIRNRIC